MAVVLSSEENSYFSSSPLRRSHSQPKFGTKHSGFHTSASTSRISDLYSQSKAFEDSIPSSAPSSPRIVAVGCSDQSCGSLTSDSGDDDHSVSFTSEPRIILPEYDDEVCFNRAGGLVPPPSPGTGHSSYTSSPSGQDNSDCTSRPGSPELCERAEDDIALRVQPSRHVDYLSHNWREEDIWSSWKLIVSRRGDYANAARLENASWRTWMKSKNKLGTVSPETLNWLKDCDVTWLYGPLQPGSSNLNANSAHPNSKRSKTGSAMKKPILKKRSMSEIMLQRSLSASSLVKQAAAAVQAQQKEGLKRIGRRPGLERAHTDYVTFPFSSRGTSQDGTGLYPSTISSGFVSPNSERKHIHFNEQVSQCIAVDVKGDDDDDEMEIERPNYDSDSDDGAIMMKRTISKKRRPILKKAKSPNAGAESKTIAMLPSTTLKYREDTPEPTESAMKHSTAYRSPIISPSSSQETLRPSKKSGKLFMVDDDDSDEDDEEETSTDWQSSSRSDEGSSGLRRSASTSSLTAEPAGMRRTESGMFMPVDESESSLAGEGLFGRVIDTKEGTFGSTSRLGPGPKGSFWGVR